jgi:adenosine deaminase
VQTKAVNNFNEHPIYDFYKDGIKVTLNTDNRTVSNTDMTKECSIMLEEFSITYEDYKQIYYNSVEASFADSDTKEKLKRYI